MRSLILLPIILFFACKTPNAESQKEALRNFDFSKIQNGGVQMILIETPKGKFKVWTKKFGDNASIKVLLLHGGPAMTHEVFECFESFFPKAGIEFYEYDQLGSFYSDQPTDSSLWVTERFVEEVEQVRQALGLNKDNFYLLGHSWGGILAMEYALKYQQNMKGLIISNMMASISSYEQYNNKLRAQMRKTLIDSMEAFEKKGDLKNPVYTNLVMNEFYTQHICRMPVQEWPDPLNRSFKHLNETIYVMMQGPSEFKTGGRLFTWDRTKDIHQLTVPTLSIGGSFDTMDPEHMKWISTEVKKGRFLLCPNGSHCDMWDDQKNYFPGLIQFLKDVDGGKL